MNAACEEYLVAVSAGDRTAALEVVGRLQGTEVGALDIMSDVIAPTQTRDDVMRHRQCPDAVTSEVLAGLRAVMAERLVATRMLSGQLGAAG